VYRTDLTNPSDPKSYQLTKTQITIGSEGTSGGTNYVIGNQTEDPPNSLTNNAANLAKPSEGDHERNNGESSLGVNDGAWIQNVGNDSTARVIRLTNLTPGQYQVVIEAITSKGYTYGRKYSVPEVLNFELGNF
jgi:hypothetical protein